MDMLCFKFDLSHVEIGFILFEWENSAGLVNEDITRWGGNIMGRILILTSCIFLI